MQKGKVLALDYGKKRIGLATGDMSLRIASPHGVVDSKNLAFAITKIVDFCEDWEIKAIVVGLPIGMDENEKNEMSMNVRHFVKKLEMGLKSSENPEINAIKVNLFDERLSSFEADRLMISAGKTGRDKKKYRDSYAACIILQRFFDSIEK